MPAWLTIRVVLYLLAALAAAFAVWALWHAIRANPEAEARLSRNQSEAAQQSGADAVNTVGQAGEREAGSADLSRTNEASIRAAPGGADPVTAEARAAGISALCKRAAYKDDPRCAP